MAKFKVGDTVRLSEVGKDLYMNHPCNPHNEKGVVIEDETGMETLRYRVKWGNGVQNAYGEAAIELVALACKLEVGKTYTARDGVERKCVHANDTHAWLVDGDTAPAYVWTIYGKAVSLTSKRDIELGQKVEEIAVEGSFEKSSSGKYVTYHQSMGDHKFNMTLTMIDGIPDWTTAKVTPQPN